MATVKPFIQMYDQLSYRTEYTETASEILADRGFETALSFDPDEVIDRLNQEPVPVGLVAYMGQATINGPHPLDVSRMIFKAKHDRVPFALISGRPARENVYSPSPTDIVIPVRHGQGSGILRADLLEWATKLVQRQTLKS